MAESSLSLGYPEIAAEVGQFLGYGRTSGSWTAAQLATVNSVVSSGLRQFYTPPPLNGQPRHEWSFLYPITTLATVASDYDYTLPDNFGGICGNFSYATTASVNRSVQIVGEHAIRELRQGCTSTGSPRYAAIRPLAFDGTTGQRFEVVMFPTPDAIYTLTYKYKIIPNAISTGNPYPFGGMSHAETILESCLSVAEQRMDDERGIHSLKFLELLASSIQQDQLAMGHDYFGYNADRSDGTTGDLPGYNVTYNSVLY
jgi:hypothetical protein